MKKLSIAFNKFLFFCLILMLLAYPVILTQNTQAQILKGGVNQDYVPQGFYGTWGVISKLISSNNPSIFNQESRDIWVLSGQSNILILENKESGAKSEVIIKNKPKQKDVLKFEREKVVEKGSEKTIYKEFVEFLLLGDTFTGSDKFVVETWVSGQLYKKSEASYSLSGIKIGGTKPY